MKHNLFRSAAVVAVVVWGSIGFEAQATWVYDTAAGTLSDGNYSFPVKMMTGTTGNQQALVDPATGERVSGLNISGVATAGSGDLDFTSVEADTGYKVIEFGAIQMVNGRADCKKVTAPDVMKMDRETFGSNTTIEELVISEKITSFPYRCFTGSSALRKITPTEFPYVTEQTTQFAFNGAKSLEGELSFPNLLKVDLSAFCGCAKLTKVSMPKVQSIGGGVFNGAGLTGDLEYPELVTIGSEAFKGVAGVTSVDAPKLEVIGTGAFQNCAGLTSFIANSVTNVGANAFNTCAVLTKIRLGAECAKNYGSGAYNGCSKLVDIEPWPVIGWGKNAKGATCLLDPFLACESLVGAIEVRVSDTIDSLPQYWMRDLYCVTSVTIRATQVTAVVAGAMRWLGSNTESGAAIYWNTEKAPTSFATSYSAFQSKGSARNRIYVKSDIEGWQKLVSEPSATDKKRADFPTKNLIGMLGTTYVLKWTQGFCIRIQ